MAKVLILVADFYKEIAEDMIESAINILDRNKFLYEVERFPGCFELPAALAMAAKSQAYDGFIMLGCVIRGETTHYDYVCGETSRGINQIAISNNLAVGFGIITTENMQQAVRRSKPGSDKSVAGNAANACIRMIEFKNKFKNLG